MATGNFHNVNASKIFAISEEDNYEGIYEDTIDNVKCELLSFDKEKKIYFVEDDERLLESELRSYPARSIGTLCKSLDFLGLDIEIEVVSIIRSGYYAGANLDYEVVLNLNGTEYCEASDIVEEVQEYSYDYDINAGLVKIHGKRLETLIETSVKKLVDTLEEIYANYTDTYVVAAQFSNGETLYKAA